jgi:Divergent InlB B-repeat domain
MASSLDTVTLDVNRDDYYGHGGSWWDVQDSDWLTHLPRVPLTLAVSGGGSVELEAGGQSLPCLTGCTDLMLDGDTVIEGLAAADAGWRVGGWSGGCTSSDDACEIQLEGPTHVTVTFVRAPVVLSVHVRGKGRVTSSPAGVDCGKSCRHAFKPGIHVRLTTSPAAGWRFGGWSGGCAGRRACSGGGEGADVVARFVRR